MENTAQPQSYPGDYYASVGDFLGEDYLQYGFAQGTQQEVDFLVDLLQLPPGARILDVGCGLGRHSLELARRGYIAVGIDISPGFIEIAQKAAQAEDLAAEFYVGDARDLNFSPEFDAAICLCEGAFGIAGDESAHRRILAGVYAALQPDARFVLTAMNAIWTVREAAKNGADLDPYSLTSHSRETLTNREGEQREVDFWTTAFTYRELKWLLEDAGFAVEGGYGCTVGKFERRPLTVEDIEIMMIARRA